MTTVHRLLDEAFADVPQTPEVLDLKEEVRGNLLARAAELEASGVGPDQAARQAFDELGDVRALAAEATDIDGDAAVERHSATTGSEPATAPSRAPRTVASAVQAHKVRPRPAFVVGVVLASVVAVLALGTQVLAYAGAGTPRLSSALLAVILGACAGWILGSSLVQETTSNHPVPLRRGLLWGLGAALVVGGLALVFGAVPRFSIPSIVAGILLVAPGVLLLSWLGATQTNRKKAWLREIAVGQAAEAGADRFERDPASAARFGIYTGAIWVVAFVAFVVLGLTVGWAWSWIVFPAALVVMMLVLARMLFGTPRE